MYNFIKELSFSQSFPPNGFFSKTLRSKIDIFRYNQLPPIKEEVGNVGQTDIEPRNFKFCSQTSNGGNCKRGRKIDRTNSNCGNECKNLIEEEWSNSNCGNECKNLIEEEWSKSEISTRSEPPLVNINCLMNVDMKQRSIWNTSFGKRLINGKAAIVETVSLPTIKKPKEEDEKLNENQNSKSMNMSQSYFSHKNIQCGVENKISQTKKKTKPVKIPKQIRKTEKQKKSNEQSHLETGVENNTSKAETDQVETSLKTDLPSSDSLTNSQVKSQKSRNQNLLSHCVQSILGVVANRYTCKYCNEIFPRVEELNSHEEKHEREKETCVLCNKLFYNVKEFTEHLLTHESVDKFSCNKCKKYFPSLKRYKAHCKNVHLKSLKSAQAGIMCNMDSMQEQTLKYFCKRCQMEFDSEENLRDHRRHHIRFDLMGAYLLSNKSTLNF